MIRNRTPRESQALLSAVGQTPLVSLDMFGDQLGSCRLFAKLESVNPRGSIKDRPVARMITRAIAAGKLGHGRRLLDSSSGNAGIAYAQFGAALGVPVTLVVPGNASQERLDRIRAHGAELVLTDPIEGYDFALRKARQLADENPERFWYSDQYSNEDNWLAHYETTGVEILDQLRQELGRGPDCFVGGVGTGGSLTGIGRRLKEADSGTHIAAIIPDVFPGIEGLKPLGSPEDIVPKILDESLIDERLPMTIEAGLENCHTLARHGLFVGPSSGAYVAAALKIAARGDRKVIVTLLNDTGERYGSTGMWREDQA